VLPIVPALAASSPFLDGVFTGHLDARLETYRHNQARIPSLTGMVIPERLFTETEYRGLFDRIAADIAPHDPDGVLDPLFLNSRGAIARFDRNAIEIRTIDIQECPAADLGVIAAVVALVRRLRTPCPECGSPGWGLLETKPGLPCSDCGTATELTLSEIWGCQRCGARRQKPRRDGRLQADPGRCPWCNP
jgi:Zn finger protein HypA/HybF involved in hydrogenase expression